MPDNNVIDKQIVELLNLQDEYELSYEDYFRALREASIAARMGDSKYSSEETDIITEELKRVKKVDKNTVFVTASGEVKEKTKKPNVKSGSVNKNKFFNKQLPSSEINQKGKSPKINLLGSKKSDTKNANVKQEKVSTPKVEKSDDGILSILKSIDKTVGSILNTLTNLNKSQQKSLENDRLRGERGRREKGESKLESGLGGIKKIGDIAKKALTPLQSVFDGIIDFVKKVILGKLFNMFVDWLSDPNNKKTFDTIVKFVADHWPLFLGAFVLFGTSFGTFIRWFIGTAARFSLSFLKIIPQLISAIARTRLGLAGLVGAGLFAAGAIIPKLFPDTVNEQERKSEKTPGTKEEKVKKLEEQKKNLNWFDQLRGVGSEIDEQIQYLQTGKTKSYADGGTLESDSNSQKKPSGFDKLKGLFGNKKSSTSSPPPSKKDKKSPGNNFSPAINVGLSISGAGRDNTLLSASPGDAVLTSNDIEDIKSKYGLNILKNIGKGKSPTNYGTNQVAVNTSESILSLDDQKSIYKNYGINIPEYLANRKPKTVKSSNIKVNNGYSSGGIIGQYQSGGIVQNTGFNPIAFDSSSLLSKPTPTNYSSSNLSSFNSKAFTSSVYTPTNFKFNGPGFDTKDVFGKESKGPLFKPDFNSEYANIIQILNSITKRDKKSEMQRQSDEIREMRQRSIERQNNTGKKEDSNNIFQTAFSSAIAPINDAFSSIWNFLGQKESENNPNKIDTNQSPIDAKTLDYIINVCVKKVCDILNNLPKSGGQQSVPSEAALPSPLDVGDSRSTTPSLASPAPSAPSVALIPSPSPSPPSSAPSSAPSPTKPSPSGGYNLFGGDKPKPDAAHGGSGSGTSSAKILQGAKSIVGMGRGVGDQCANTTRAALKAAGHPGASKTTKKGDLDTPKGTAYSAPSFAASFGGSDMGQIITQKSQIKAGDIILWRANVSKGGNINKGAITHVGIAADDGLKHQYDHNRSRGFHYRPHWDSAAGTSWFAGVRLGGTGGGTSTPSTPESKSEGQPTQGGSGGSVGSVGDSREGSPEQKKWTLEDQKAFDAKGTGAGALVPSLPVTPAAGALVASLPVAPPQGSTEVKPTEKLVPKVSGAEIDKMSIEQLRGMLDPTKTGASNPAVFAAARSARAEAVALGLPKEEVERRVLVASVKAKQGISTPNASGVNDNSISGTINELRQMRARSLDRQGRSSEASILRSYGTNMPNLLSNLQGAGASLSSGFNIPKGSITPDAFKPVSNLLSTQPGSSLSSGFDISYGSALGGFKPIPGLTSITNTTGTEVPGSTADSRRLSGGMFGKFDVSPGEVLMNPYVITKAAADQGAATEALSSVQNIVAKYDSASRAAQENVLRKPNNASQNIKPYSANTNKSTVSTLPPISKNTGSPGSPPISGTKEVFFPSVCPVGHAKAERSRILDSLGVLFV